MCEDTSKCDHSCTDCARGYGEPIILSDVKDEGKVVAESNFVCEPLSTNEKISLIADGNTTYPVMEIFTSIQGEGSMLGMPVTFIRMAGCNLACPWCDTKESWKKDAKRISIMEIVDQCAMAIVVITGGEPCLQNLVPLIEALHLKEKFVCIETNGTLPTPEGVDWVVCSPKPAEYEINAQCWFNELKYVVDDNFDADTCIPEDCKKTCGTVWLQPCDYGEGEENKAKTRASMQKCIDLTLKKGYLRTGIQLHKILDVK